MRHGCALGVMQDHRLEIEEAAHARVALRAAVWRQFLSAAVCSVAGGTMLWVVPA